MMILDEALRAVVREAVRETLRAELPGLLAAALPPPAPTRASPRWLTVREACAEARVTPRTLYRWIADGKLEAKHSGSRRLVEREELARFINKKPDPTACPDPEEEAERILARVRSR